jgi:hypothetical protein
LNAALSVRFADTVTNFIEVISPKLKRSLRRHAAVLRARYWHLDHYGRDIQCQ